MIKIINYIDSISSATIDKILVVGMGESFAVILLITDLVGRAEELSWVIIKTVIVTTLGAIIPLIIRHLWNKMIK